MQKLPGRKKTIELYFHKEDNHHDTPFSPVNTDV